MSKCVNEQSTSNPERSIFGKPLVRIDAKSKVTGEAKFVADLSIPKMLWGKILRSPHAHAKLISIDTKEAEKLPGVRAVITAKDTPMIRFSFIQALADKLPLCHDKVRFMGDEVAAVAADDLEIAEKAIRLIKVEYEKLPVVTNLGEAVKDGAPKIHENAPNNIAFKIEKEFGNIEQGFKEADRVYEDQYVTSKQAHCCMETYGCIASWERAGHLTVWAPLQAPHTTRQELARILDVPQKFIHVKRTTTGGAFGARLVTDIKVAIAALLSRETGRPVKIINTREEEFLSAKTRYPYIIHIKTGVTNDGRIVARHLRIDCDNGAYTDKGSATLNYVGVVMSVLYNIPHIKYECRGIYTNTQYGTAFRGFGNPQFAFASEQQLDKIARDLGIDPIEIRYKNANKPGDATKSGARITSCNL